MAVVKANYVKRGTGDSGRAKASLRYIMHRRDRDGNRLTRELFGFDGSFTKQEAYELIDAAPQKGRYYYRFVFSPDPAREDTYRDIGLMALTIFTMYRLEERLGKSVQFVSAIHDDHSPHRHVHAIVIHNGRRLTREDFAALRQEATKRARNQRRELDRLREIHVRKSRTRASLLRREMSNGRLYRNPDPLLAYTCPLCGAYRALPYSTSGYRCLADGVYLRRVRSYERSNERSRSQSRELALERTLSP
jgi:hypothetical protein